MNGWPYWVLLVSYLLQLTAFWFLLRSHNRLLDDPSARSSTN